MNTANFETLMYYLIKDACRESFIEWLEDRGLTEDDYEKIKIELEKQYNIKMYV